MNVLPSPSSLITRGELLLPWNPLNPCGPHRQSVFFGYSIHTKGYLSAKRPWTYPHRKCGPLPTVCQRLPLRRGWSKCISMGGGWDGLLSSSETTFSLSLPAREAQEVSCNPPSPSCLISRFELLLGWNPHTAPIHLLWVIPTHIMPRNPPMRVAVREGDQRKSDILRGTGMMI